MSKDELNPAIDFAIAHMLQDLSKEKDFEKKKEILELAMKFEALKIKAKGASFGKGFDQDDDGGADADTTF